MVGSLFSKTSNFLFVNPNSINHYDFCEKCGGGDGEYCIMKYSPWEIISL